MYVYYHLHYFHSFSFLSPTLVIIIIILILLLFLRTIYYYYYYSWFFGFLSANESKMFLQSQPTGTYLIRFSQTSKIGSFVLDYVQQPGSVCSVRLNPHPSGKDERIEIEIEIEIE